jgi:hypothetical protein
MPYLHLLRGNRVRERKQRQRQIDEGVVVLFDVRLAINELW